MKKRLLTIFATTFCLSISAVEQPLAKATNVSQKSFKVVVSNNSEIDKVDEPVCVKLKDVKGIKFIPNSAKVEATFSSPNGGEANKRYVPCQLDDMDGNMEADELFFLINIKAHESKTFEVMLSSEENEDSYEARIYTALQIRDRKDLHPNVMRVEAPGQSNIYNDIYMHGITVESDLVGYRIYFDERQNIDIYGKTKRRIELPVTQFYTTEEQIKEGWGVDVLWAGKAMGCGSFKRWSGDAPQNWIGKEVKVRGERIVTTGPLRTIVEVYDLGIKQCNNKNEGTILFDVHQYYTLYAGHRDIKVEVKFSKPTPSDTFFSTGVQKVGVNADEATRRGHKSEGWMKNGIATSWGCDYPDMNEAKKKYWLPEAIGMAVYVPQQYICGEKEDELNYAYILRPKKQEINYWVSFCAAREEAGYKNSKEWFNSLERWKKNVESQVSVKIR